MQHSLFYINTIPNMQEIRRPNSEKNSHDAINEKSSKNSPIENNTNTHLSNF